MQFWWKLWKNAKCKINVKNDNTLELEKVKTAFPRAIGLFYLFDNKKSYVDNFDGNFIIEEGVDEYMLLEEEIPEFGVKKEKTNAIQSLIQHMKNEKSNKKAKLDEEVKFYNQVSYYIE